MKKAEREKREQPEQTNAEPTAAQALQGLCRLALGKTNDAVLLAMSEEPWDIRLLDLFHVSEIKRPKGGGCEIKFYDRLEALRTLLEYCPADKRELDTAASLYKALELGAKALKKDGGGKGGV